MTGVIGSEGIFVKMSDSQLAIIISEAIHHRSLLFQDSNNLTLLNMCTKFRAIL